MAQVVKNLPAMQETWVRSLGWEYPWREERLLTPVFWPGEFMGSQRIGHDWATFTFTSLDYTAFLSIDGMFCKAGFGAIVEIQSKSYAKLSMEQEMRVATCNLTPRLESCSA